VCVYGSLYLGQDRGMRIWTRLYLGHDGSVSVWVCCI
jgi:hypothetical protein